MQPPAWQPPHQQPPPAQPAWRPPVPDTPEAAPNLGHRVSVMDALRFVFSTDDWKNNLLISSVFMFIPLIGPIANTGWHAEIVQRLARRDPRPIPRLEFSDLMHYAARGAPAFFVAVVVMLPIMFLSYVVMFVGIFGGTAVASAVNEPAVLGVVWAIIGVFWLVLLFAMGMFVHAAQARAELTESFGEAISPGKVLQFLGKTWGTLLVSTILLGLASVPIVLLGYLMCIFGLYPAIVLVTIAASHLRWQLYERYLLRGGEPFAIKPPQQLPSEAAAAWHAQYQQQYR